MINSTLNLEKWVTLLYELSDAQEHLEGLIKEMEKNGVIDEVDYSIQLGHIFAHLNRAWNSRKLIIEETDSERESFSSYPEDLEPVG